MEHFVTSTFYLAIFRFPWIYNQLVFFTGRDNVRNLQQCWSNATLSWCSLQRSGLFHSDLFSSMPKSSRITNIGRGFVHTDFFLVSSFLCDFSFSTRNCHFIESERLGRSFITLPAAHPSPCPPCDARHVFTFSPSELNWAQMLQRLCSSVGCFMLLWNTLIARLLSEMKRDAY